MAKNGTGTAELILMLARQVVLDHLTDDDAEPVIKRARVWLAENAPELLRKPAAVWLKCADGERPALTAETADLVLALTRQVLLDHLTDDAAEPVINRGIVWLAANAPELLKKSAAALLDAQAAIAATKGGAQ